MKKCKKALSWLLAAAMFVCSISALDLSAFAVEINQNSDKECPVVAEVGSSDSESDVNDVYADFDDFDDDTQETTSPSTQPSEQVTTTQPNVDIPESYEQYGYLNSSDVYLRPEPNIYCTITATLGKFTCFAFVDSNIHNSGWYKVRLLSTNQEGYIYKTYVVPCTTTAGYISKNNSAILRGASTDASAITYLKKYTPVNLVYTTPNNGYYYVVSENGKLGYVLCGSITLSNKKTGTNVVPYVAQVSNLHKINNYEDNITLAWNKVSNISGYVLTYCNMDKTTEYTTLKELSASTTSVKISNLAPTTKYNFKLYAFVKRDGIKYMGQHTLIRTLTKPAKPKNILLTDSSGKITFKWNKVDKASGYKIYRSVNNINGSYSLYKTLKGSGTTSFTDNNTKKGSGYFYKVMAYREVYGVNENRSYETKISAVSGLNPPKVTHASRLQRLNLEWEKVAYADGYEIFYSEKKDGSFTYLGSTTKLFYNTKKLTNKKTYYFKVLPFKYVGPEKTKVKSVHQVHSRGITDQAFGKKDISNTYIEISLKQQHMWMYVDGKLYAETDVVTGNDDGYHNTPRGPHKITERKSPATLVGADYVTPVKYWLKFTNSGCGIHDSTWRASYEYGGTTYKGNGSHGCVNTPYNAVSKIYSKARVGMYVVIY